MTISVERVVFTVLFLAIGVIILSVFASATLRGRAKAVCLEHGFAEATLGGNGYYCIRRVNGSDSVVSVDRLQKAGGR